MSFIVVGLSHIAISVMEQLFISGPVSDGNIISKKGRDELVGTGFAFHEDGWASLTSEGMKLASNWDLEQLYQRRDRRWYLKLRAS